MTWIPVTERLPDTDKEVLFFTDPYFWIGHYDKEENKWLCTEFMDHDAKFWMDIPPLPSEEENYEKERRKVINEFLSTLKNREF